MGWKSVEMQVAIPRTVEASNIQQQMTKHHERFQESLTQHQLSEQLKKRKTVHEYEETDRIKQSKDEQSSNHQQDNQEKQSTDDQEKSQIEHPYLGSQFDVKG